MPSLASKSSGGHQVSLSHSTEDAVHIDIISDALLFLRLEDQRKKRYLRKHPLVLSDVTTGWGAGCSSPGCLLVTGCEVGFRGDRSVTTATRC